MWIDFADKNPDGDGYQIYFIVFQEENIVFSRPSVDDCEICLMYEDHINGEDMNEDVLMLYWDKKLMFGMEKRVTISVYHMQHIGENIQRQSFNTREKKTQKQFIYAEGDSITEVNYESAFLCKSPPCNIQ